MDRGQEAAEYSISSTTQRAPYGLIEEYAMTHIQDPFHGECSEMLDCHSESDGSCKPLQPRAGEPRQHNKAYQGQLMAIGPYEGLFGSLGSASLGSNGLYEWKGCKFKSWGFEVELGGAH